MRPAACTATLAPMSARNRAQVRLRIDFDAGASIGPGKVALLEQIDHCGSLSQAARDLGLSYRRAWNLLDDLNHAFAEPVVATVTGGARGGGARITALGRQIVERYRKVEKLDGGRGRSALQGAGSRCPFRGAGQLRAHWPAR